MIKFVQKEYSSNVLSKYDLVEILIPNVVKAASGSIIERRGISGFFTSMAVNVATDLISVLLKSKVKEFKNARIGNLSNKDLISILEKFGYRKRRDYTIGDKNSKVTLHMNNGILLISIEKGYDDKLVSFMKKTNSKITNIGDFTLISYQAGGRSELERTIDIILKYVKKVNIYNNE